MQNEQPGSSNDVIQLPSPTVWPMVLALGISLLSAGMVTNAAIGLLGVLLAAAGSVGWFFQVLPNEAHEPVEVCADAVLIASARTCQRPSPQAQRAARSFPSRPSRSPAASRAESPEASP
jgi:hypothetical protein